MPGDSISGPTPVDPEPAASATDEDESANGSAITLSISPKRALVSVAFLGALLARHRGRPAQY